MVFFSSRFSKFLIVAVAGTTIDFSTFYIFHWWLLLPLVPSNILSVSLAITNAFFCNRAWTFADSTRKSKLRFFQYFYYSSIGLLINTMIVWTFADIVPVYFAKTVAIAVMLLFNYNANKHFVFRVK